MIHFIWFLSNAYSICYSSYGATFFKQRICLINFLHLYLLFLLSNDQFNSEVTLIWLFGIMNRIFTGNAMNIQGDSRNKHCNYHMNGRNWYWKLLLVSFGSFAPSQALFFFRSWPRNVFMKAYHPKIINFGTRVRMSPWSPLPQCHQSAQLLSQGLASLHFTLFDVESW